MPTPTPSQPDADARKGATEDTAPEDIAAHVGQAHNRLAGQLSHRESNSEIKDADSDFPEPGSSPEHT